MENSSKKKESNIKIRKNSNINDIEKSKLINLLINEIEYLSENCKKISNYLILLANQFDVKKINKEDIIKNINILNHHKELFEYITKNSYDLNKLNIMIKGFNNKIKEEKNDDKIKNYFLKKKRYKKETEEVKDVIAKIRKYKDNYENIIGYYIKVISFDKIYKLGPWNNLKLVMNLKNIFINKLNEYNIEENNKSKFIEKFYLKFKNKAYRKYPPLENIL